MRLEAIGRGAVVGVADLPASVAAAPAQMGPLGDDVLPIREVQRRYAAWALEKSGGHKTRTAEKLGVDSLHYLSLEGVYEAVGASRATHCDACFTGDYPLAGTEAANGKHAFEDDLLVKA